MTLNSTRSSSGMDAPSLTVEDKTSLEPKASLIPSVMSELFEEVMHEEAVDEECERFEDSKAELNPEGVSRSAILRKLGSPRTEKEKVTGINYENSSKLTLAESEN